MTRIDVVAADGAVAIYFQQFYIYDVWIAVRKNIKLITPKQANDRHETCYAGILLSVLSYYGVVIRVAVVERAL